VLEKFQMSPLRLLSVPHCTEVGMIAVAIDKQACGEPLGWCPSHILGKRSRESSDYVGLRIWNDTYGECWGHTLRAWLPSIFTDVVPPPTGGTR
jgi:hypothetical protein